MDTSTWLLTGASSGLGYALSAADDDRCHTAVAGQRSAERTG